MEEEIEKLPNKDPQRIFLGGYSEGCMVALAAFLKYQGTAPLGGIIGLSGMQVLDQTQLDISPE